MVAMNTVCWHMTRRVRTGRCVSLYRCTRALGHDGEHRHVVQTRCIKHGPACPTYPSMTAEENAILTCASGCVQVDGVWEPAFGCPYHNQPIFKEEKDLSEKELKRDNVSHYTVGEIETIDFIFDKLGYEGGLEYILGNLIKYSSRANHKGQRRSDIVKIRNYATIALEHMDKHGETS